MMRKAIAVWVGVAAVVVSSIGFSADWRLAVNKQAGSDQINSLIWVDGPNKMPAVSAELLDVIKSAQTQGYQGQLIYVHPAFAHGALSIPSMLDGGIGMSGALIPLIPGKVAKDTDGISNQPRDIAMEANGFYFTVVEGNALRIRYYHLTPMDDGTQVETLNSVSLYDVDKGNIKVKVADTGVEVANQSESVVYRPHGRTVMGGFIFDEATTQNMDELKADFGARDLTEMAKQGQLDPIEDPDVLAEVSRILSGKKKRNVLVTGEEGFDLQDPVKNLAVAISKNKVPELKGWRVVQIDWTQLSTDGLLEKTLEKINKIMAAVRQKKIILYFDQIDKLVGMGVDPLSRKSGSDAVAAIAPEVTMGRVILIGTANNGVDGLERLKSSAPNFFDQFQPVKLQEPDGAHLLHIVEVAAQRRQEDFGTHFSDDLLKKIIQDTSQFIRGKKQPQKALMAINDLSQKYGVDTAKVQVINPIEVTAAQFRAWLDKKSGFSHGDIDVDGLRKFLHKKVVGHEAEIDKVCDQLQLVKYGAHTDPTPLAFFALIGTPGVGKTYMAKLVADYLTGPNSAQLVDMKLFSNFTQDNPVYKTLKGSPDALHVVIFDDVDHADRDTQDKLAGVIEEGYFAQGSSNELAFSNSIVFFTGNWGQELIASSTHSSDNSFQEKLRQALTDPKDPKVDPRLWSRMSGHMLVMWPFKPEELIQLTMTMAKDTTDLIKATKDVDVLVDPRLLVEVAASEKEEQAGARSMKTRLQTDVFANYAVALSRPGVKKIVLYQLNLKVQVFTNLDGDDFTEAWNEVQNLSKMSAKELAQQYGLDQ